MSSNTVINTNIVAINSQIALKNVSIMQSRASEKLSTGLRINSAADDAAGMAISEKMEAQIRGLDQAVRNSGDGISLIQTAEGGLSEMTDMMQRVRELTVQSANDTNTVEDREKIDMEIVQLGEEITSMSDRVEFNDQKLLNGTTASGKSLKLQIGANEGQLMSVSIGGGFASMGMDVVSNLTTASKSAGSISSQIETVDKYLNHIVTERSKLGAYQNRLEHTINSLEITSENLSAARSRITDADMAKEMMNLTAANVLQQAATNMLGQANHQPEAVLQLLR